jgi:Protein of unknown function (DUF1648)
MKTFRSPQILFILLVMGIILGFAICYPRLPERMASHFAMDGRPNGWQPKSAFTIFFFGALGIACVVSLAVPKLLGSLPLDMINLPNKEYWLAPGTPRGLRSLLAGSNGLFWLRHSRPAHRRHV